MVEVAEFEEKTYEKYFGHELSTLTRQTYSPGQVAESELGFDEAFRLPWLSLRHFPHPGRWWWTGPGISLGHIEHVAEVIGIIFPKFRFNLFVQYKRPEWIGHHRGGEWSSWSQPYYRYRTTPHQQLALERIASAAGERASVIYAAPAFWRANDLHKAAEQRRVVARSNCTLATNLSGHNRFSYVAAGSQGVAHSEPIRFEGPTVEAIVARGWEQPELAFGSHLKRVAQAVEAGLKEDAETRIRLTSARSALLRLAGYDVIPPADSIVYAMATLEGFQDAFGAALYCLGGPPFPEASLP